MKIEQGPIKDLYVITPTVYEDSRGYFFESFNQQFLREKGIYLNFVQDNQSVSVQNVIRGLHFQKHAPQSKLVRCIVGKVIDVVVDLRKASPTYKKTFQIELSEENMKMVLIPNGCAHGFSVLSEVAIFHYKCDEVYLPNQDGGIIYNDPQFSIDWKVDVKDAIISEKDKALPQWDEIEKMINF